MKPLTRTEIKKIWTMEDPPDHILERLGAGIGKEVMARRQKALDRLGEPEYQQLMRDHAKQVEAVLEKMGLSRPVAIRKHRQEALKRDRLKWK